MMANTLSRRIATTDINHLRLGDNYEATTYDGRTVSGLYLGIEVAYDDFCILLRNSDGTTSIAVADLDSVDQSG